MEFLDIFALEANYAIFELNLKYVKDLVQYGTRHFFFYFIFLLYFQAQVFLF